MHTKFLLLIFFLLTTLSVTSQTFDDIKDQEIEFTGNAEEDLERFISMVYGSFLGKDFDSTDLEMFLDGPILGSFLVTMYDEKPITYGLFYDKLLEIKQHPEYPEAKRKKVLLNKLMSRPADIANWEKDKPAFEEIGFEADMLDEFYEYLKAHSNPLVSYREIFIPFREQVKERKRIEKEMKTTEVEKLLYAKIPFNETELLAQSKRENKPVLLYFTGYACVNCRKIEQAVLFEPDVANPIMDEFIFVPLYVDERTELPLEEQTTIEIQGRTRDVKTIGQKHLYYQITRFDIAAQPYFVVLNSENAILGDTNYEESRTVRDFQAFMQSSLEKFAE